MGEYSIIASFAIISCHFKDIAFASARLFIHFLAGLFISSPKRQRLRSDAVVGSVCLQRHDFNAEIEDVAIQMFQHSHSRTLTGYPGSENDLLEELG
jgi:hypothetical protein